MHITDLKNTKKMMNKQLLTKNKILNVVSRREFLHCKLYNDLFFFTSKN